MIGPLRDWDSFWFQPQTTRVLGLYRIVLGLLILYSFSLFAKDVTVFFSDAGVLTVATLEKVMDREYHTVLKWIHSAMGVQIILGALFVTGFFFTVGFYTRLNAILLFVLVTSFHERNHFVLNHGDSVLRTMLFCFMFAPAGTSFSVDSLLRRLHQPEGAADVPRRHPLWAQRMMQIQTTIIYLTAAYAKSRGDLYHNGSAMYYVFGLIDFNVYGIEQLMNYPIFYSSLTFGTVLVEISLPFLLWFRSIRPYAVLAGIFLHSWVMWCMTIPVFGIVMIATYIPFHTEAELDEVVGWFRKRFMKRKARILLDETCPSCRRLQKVVRILDLFERVECAAVYCPCSGEKVAYPGNVRLITPEGTTLSDLSAWRWLAFRFPATFWIAPVLCVPGLTWAVRCLRFGRAAK